MSTDLVAKIMGKCSEAHHDEYVLSLARACPFLNGSYLNCRPVNGEHFGGRVLKGSGPRLFGRVITLRVL